MLDTDKLSIWPYYNEDEKSLLNSVLRSNEWSSKGGKIGSEFEKYFSQYLGINFAFACTNGTHALELALKSLDIGFMDYVIVPSITFTATALAVLSVGAYPIFADVDLHTACVSLEAIENIYKKYNKKVKCVIAVHMGGQSCDMDSIVQWCKENTVMLIEDCAQGIGGKYKEKKLGTIGDVGCFSFQNSKNITSGEGGAVITDDKAIAVKLSKYIDFNNSSIDYDNRFEYLGGNYRLSEFQSAILLAQLKRFDELNSIREKNYNYLLQDLSTIEGINPVTRMNYMTRHGCHFLMLRYQKQYFNNKDKKVFLEYLWQNDIPSFGGYDNLPLDLFSFFKDKLFLRHDPLWRGISKKISLDLPKQDVCKNALILANEFIWICQQYLLRSDDNIQRLKPIILKFKD